MRNQVLVFNAVNSVLMAALFFVKLRNGFLVYLKPAIVVVLDLLQLFIRDIESLVIPVFLHLFKSELCFGDIKKVFDALFAHLQRRESVLLHADMVALLSVLGVEVWRCKVIVQLDGVLAFHGMLVLSVYAVYESWIGTPSSIML